MVFLGYIKFDKKEENTLFDVLKYFIGKEWNLNELKKKDIQKVSQGYT